ncbi:MAG TPA: hypothetical protein VIV60_27200 [Polyangiaceae bacterium]
MEIYALQGDLRIEKLAKISGKLTPANNLVLAGSHEGEHVLIGTCETRMEGDVRLVSVKRATKIVHASRHQETRLATGCYSIVPQRERGGEGDRAVED